MDAGERGRREHRLSVARVADDLIVQAQLLEQPEHPLRARIFEMMDLDHDAFLCGERGQLLDQLGGERRGDAVQVARRMKLDDVGADDRARHAVEHRQHLADAEPARLVMRDAGREGGIEPVEVDADVERRVGDRHALRREIAHLDHLDSEPLRLRAAMGVERPDADLDQPARMPALHDPREGRGVAERIAFEIVVEIGMGVEMEDVERAVDSGERGDDRPGDHMIAAERDRHGALAAPPPRRPSRISAGSPASSVSGRSPISSTRMSTPSSSPFSAAALPCSEASAARIAAGAAAAPRRKERMAVGRQADQADPAAVRRPSRLVSPLPRDQASSDHSASRFQPHELRRLPRFRRRPRPDGVRRC